jgi:hypothetical protein
LQSGWLGRTFSPHLLPDQALARPIAMSQKCHFSNENPRMTTALPRRPENRYILPRQMPGTGIEWDGSVVFRCLVSS